MNSSIVTSSVTNKYFAVFLFVVSVFSVGEAFADSSVCANVTVVSTDNRPCIKANAGHDLQFALSQTVYLDGSATTNRFGGALSFNWELIEKPPGSLVELANSHSVKTSFTPDTVGNYVFVLTVTDSDGNRGSDRVLLSTSAVKPVAVITTPVNSGVGESVTLDGSQSMSANGGALDYNWEIIEKPTASRTFIDAANTRSPAMTLDAPGRYAASLIVNNGTESSERTTVEWSTQVRLPLANAGVPRTLSAGSTVLLDGADLQALNEAELTYQWSMLYAPPTSTAQLSDPGATSPRFVADRAGYYLVQLVVNNGEQASRPSTVLFEAKSSRRLASMVSAGQSTRTLGQNDTDADGVVDLEDNCMLVANPSQRDTDGDGYGNFCDADFNNDGVVNFLDFFFWRERFLTSDPDADLDGSGSVNFLDGAIMNSFYLLPPGPVGAVRWSSPVDGDWANPLNWTPQVVPDENLIAIVDIAEDVTVSLIDTVAIVKGLVMNESMLIEDGTLEAIEAVELGGQISGAMTRINNTTFNPSAQGSGEVFLDAGPHVWQGNTLNVDGVIDTGATLFNGGGLTINETLTIDSHWFATAIEFTDTQTVDGVGTLVLDGLGNPINPAIALSPASQTTVTFGSELVIRGGRSVIGSETGNISLLGNVTSDIAGEELGVGGNTWSASGELAAISGGSLLFFGNLENAGSTLNVDSSNAEVLVTPDSDWSLANIIGSAGTVLTLQAGSSAWTDMNFDVDMLLENGAEVRVYDGFSLNGTATIRSTSSPTGLCFYSGQIISGEATFIFDAANNPESGDAYLCAGTNISPALTMGPQTTVSGGNGRLYTTSSNAEIVFNGQVNSNVADTSIAIMGGRFSGSGTLGAANGGILEIAADFDNAGAPIAIDGADGRIVMWPGATLENAVINATPGTLLEYSLGSDSEVANVVLNADVLVSDSRVVVNGDLELNGTLTLARPIATDSILNFSGTHVLTGNATIILVADQFPSVTKPRITGGDLSPLTNLTIPETFIIRSGGQTGFGTVDIGEGISSLVLDGQLSVEASRMKIIPTTFSVSSGASVSVVNERTLTTWSLGAASGNVHLGAGSTFKAVPSEPLSLSSQSSFEFDIASPSLAGQFETEDSIAYAGELTINLVDGFNPQVGDSFELFTHGSFTGAFDSVVSQGVNPGESFVLSYTQEGVTATLASAN